MPFYGCHPSRRDPVGFVLLALCLLGQAPSRSTQGIAAQFPAYIPVYIGAGNVVIVRFDIPVERTSVSYCPVSLGCDYTVHSLGHWEYQQLEQDLPVINIEVDEDYIGKFWLAISNTLNA